MFLIYVFHEGSWEFWESITWNKFFDLIYDVTEDINNYLEIKFDVDLPFFGRWHIDENKFLYDMIHYKQYVSELVVFYYIDMPGGSNG